MAFNGSGVFERLYNWVTDRDNSIKITASRMDNEMDGMATGLSTCITRDGQTTITADLPMSGYKHTDVDDATARNHYAASGQVQDGSFIYAADSGLADAYVITLAPAITAYAAGQTFRVKVGNTNTGASTINVNGVGAQTIKKNVSNDVEAGDLQAGEVVSLMYDGTNFQLQPTAASAAPSFIFDTVSAMKASTFDGLAVGKIVETKGYFASGDGGGGTYLISANQSVDGYGDHLLSNTNTAILQKNAKERNIVQYGAKGDGVTDDSGAIQAAIDSLTNGGVVKLPMSSGGGDYRVTATKGTNDKYGLKITSSGVTLLGETGVRLRRLSSDISTYALAFPILLIGVPDDDSTQVTNTKVQGITFYGENTRHSTSGSALMDGRQAIWLKNVKGALIKDNLFDNIDSGAIYTQAPGELDYENTQFYNITKCYDITITGNRFAAQAHTTAGRALIHSIVSKADNVVINDNHFYWCDVCVDCETTYGEYSDKETDTYTDGNLAASVKRTGRNTAITGNTCYNSSEHSFYLNGMSVSCTGNSINVDDFITCNTNHIQIRGRGVTVSGNTLTGVASGASITTGSFDVTFSGNTITSNGDSAAGVINIQSQGLTAYIDARAWLLDYRPLRNVIVSGNVIDQKNASQTGGVGIRIYTDTTDANFPDGQLQNVGISGNSINRAKTAILNIAPMAKRVLIHDNVFNGKDFTESGFSTSTTMNSQSVLAVDDSLTTPLGEVSFDNNKVYGFEYILYDDGGAGSGMSPPRGVRGNTMDYIKYWDTSAFNQPDFNTRFRNNTGHFFLDRTGWFSFSALENSLSDGTSNTDRKSCMLLVSSTDVRIYYDDLGSFKAL